MPIGVTHLQCLCGAVREPASLLECTELPIETELCHCNICRQTSGALGGAFARLRDRPTSTKACGRYTRPGGRVDRYFCSTCGTRTYDHVTDADYWLACSGMLEPDHSQDDIVRITQHEYVADTIDGGLANFMRSLQGRIIPCYADGKQPSKLEMTTAQVTQLSKASTGPREDKLYVSCHCGAVQFHVVPPQPSNTRWMGADGTKNIAQHCACRSCRLAVGFSFASYVYVQPENIVTAKELHGVSDEGGTVSKQQNAELAFDYTSQDQIVPSFDSTEHLRAVFPGLKFYFSSPQVRWSFCTTCGAKVFGERENRPEVVNIAMGVLRAQSGALAHDWFDHNLKIWYADEAVDKQFIKAFGNESGLSSRDDGVI